MTKKLLVACIACVAALCLVLAGCGNSAEDAKKAFTGTWDLSEMSQNDEITSSEDIETLKSLGLEVYANLNEDGSAALVLFGQVIEGTWEASSTTAGTITLEGQKVDMKIDGEKLSFAQENAILTFVKGEKKETPEVEEEDVEGMEGTEGTEGAEGAEGAEGTAAEGTEGAAAEGATAEGAEGSEAAASGEAASAAASAESVSAASAE